MEQTPSYHRFMETLTYGKDYTIGATCKPEGWVEVPLWRSCSVDGVLLHKDVIVVQIEDLSNVDRLIAEWNVLGTVDVYSKRSHYVWKYGKYSEYEKSESNP